MKKNKCYISLGISLLAVVAVGILQTTDAYADPTTSDTNTKIEQNAGKLHAGVQSELIQSEDTKLYRKTQLDNTFGASNNQSTGVYKRSTDSITIYVDERTDQTQMPTYSISPITLNQYREGNSEQLTLKKGKNTINNTSEGIIHIQNISNTTPQQKLVVTVDGGIKLPRFILGKTTEADWQNQVRQNPNAPGYELVGTHTLVTGSKATLNYVKSPKQIVETYDKVVKFHDESSGLDNSSSLHRRNRGLVQHMRETQEPGFYMYAWFSHTAYSKNTGMPNVLSANLDNIWGPMHEFGHTYQMNRMTWKNQTEVTVNIYSMRSEKQLGGKSRLERDGVYDKIFAYFKQTNKNYDDNSDLFVKLGMFWQLELAFGDDFYPQLHKLYREEAKSLANDSAKQQYFITSTSKIANKNLLPYFEMWGLPVTAETKQAIQKYPKLTHKIWESRDEMKNPISPIDPVQPEKPAAPTNLSALDVKHDSVKIKWNAVQGNQPIKEYSISRDGREIARTTTTEFTDKTVQANTAYTYTVSAINTMGTSSDKSAGLQVKTPTAPIIETPAPSKPANVVSSNITQDSITLTWTASNSPIGVSGYNIYRNGIKISTVRTASFKDSNLQANTMYTYQITAFDSKNKESVKSDSTTLKTKEAENQLSTWESNKVYTAGNKVFYNGLEYEAKWWTQGNRPDSSDVWKLLSNKVMDWEYNRAYNGGDTVTFQGKTYKAKWWTQGNQPGNTPVWELI
ncbi:M60 family metallopeptidase [Candidatus Enterococcus ikei]|uniref:M60 family metallopeptidase n=1 Tax=Candidatus Enterococcus ikei TaxID=2815326 RepID=A0ABS3GYX0_9ENTE|nr:M60 family metallopeptidase [Enterococcus sp. DIV0869a]MBO0440463.1 M60 family metallopeptidase [Enterococcus sp. DIV0869a]